MYSWLWPSLPPYHLFMKLKRTMHTVYPFNHPRKYYFCYARVGIHHLARKLKRLGCNQVLFPAYHHGVEVEAMLAAGVCPVYYNVHTSGEIDYDDLERKITPATRAFYIIHYNGIPQDMDAVMSFKRKHDLLLIEDAALSLFSRYGSKNVGEFGDVSIFCLYKTLPIPNGGLLVINRPELDIDVALRRPDLRSTFRRLVALQLYWCGGKLDRVGRRVQEMRANVREVPSSGSMGLQEGGGFHFDTSMLEWGISRWSEFIIERSDVEEIIRRRRENFQYLSLLLKNMPVDIQPMYRNLPPGAVPLCFPILIQDRQAIYEDLLNQGIESGLVWPREQVAVPGIKFPEVAQLKERVLALPIHQRMTRHHIEYLADRLEKVVSTYPRRRAAA